MSEIELTGLIGSHPLAAMAAFGLLRFCAMNPDLSDSRLSWRSADWVAILHTPQTCDKERLLSALVDLQEGASAAPHLGWSDDIKVDPALFKTQLEDVREDAHLDDRQTADFFAAYGSESIRARSTSDVKPTAFHMVAGQQQFPKAAREAGESLDASRPPGSRIKPAQWRADCAGAFAEALFGPWRYKDGQHSLGWDPSVEALYALTSMAPTRAGPASVRAAVWLAFNALPLFPCFAIGKHLHTRGFDYRSRSFTWPIWTPPASLDVVRTLLADADLYGTDSAHDDLSARGVIAVFRSDRRTDANGRGTLRHAVPVTLA